MSRFISRQTLIVTALAAVVITIIFFTQLSTIERENPINVGSASTAAVVALPFTYPFSVDGQLGEVSVMDNSSSPWWWVSSGGYMTLANGVGQTIQGSLPAGSKWQVAYNNANPVDTDNGAHPQNIFRMVFRTSWQNLSQETYFKINKYNLSSSPNRNASNGLFFMSRYVDQNNLYYTGLRVDGYAVIKKKIAGKYYTMAYTPVLKGGTYNASSNPNLLPVGTQVGMRTVVKNLDATRVQIQMYADFGRAGNWVLVASAVDDGRSYGGPAITQAGRVGMRTDFMDAQFDDFNVKAL